MKLYSLVHTAKMRKLIKILIYILLTLTLVYWIGWLLYKFLELLRKIIHCITEKEHWWFFLSCILLLAIGTFIVAQFVLGLNPYGKIIDWFKYIIEKTTKMDIF